MKKLDSKSIIMTSISVIVFFMISCGNAEDVSDAFDEDYNYTAEAQEVCETAGGDWREFSNGCGDTCALFDEEPVLCTQAFTDACDCGESQCWDGESCIDNPN